MRALALTRCIEIIGEAAAFVSSEYKTTHPCVLQVDLKVVLDTAHQALAPLVATLDQLMADVPEPSADPKPA